MNRPIKRAAAAVCVVACLGTARTNAAFSPDQTDILGLRLGMMEAAVMDGLLRQGIRPERVARRVGTCAAVADCVTTLTGPTHDGELTIDLRGKPPMVDRIAYRLFGRASGGPDLIIESALTHYGPPDQREPMAWCQRQSTGDGCPEGQPALRFDRQTLTAVLTSGRR